MRARTGLFGLVAVVVLVVAGSVSAPAGATPGPVCAAGTCTVTFAETGAQDSWVAPAGVASITVDAYGASGFQLTEPSGRTQGLGAHVQATLAVTPGHTYYVTVGGAGSFGVGGGGFNGGGDGGTFDTSGFGLGSIGGGGGGATDFRTSSALSDRVVVAGGGGGDSWPTLGGNSGSDGNNGVCSLESSNDGGTCVANAVGGKAGTSGGAVGGTGESVDGITGADAADVAAGSAVGGAGASWPAPFDDNTFLDQFGGGGGGGGYYGGSGGGAGMLVDISGLNGSDGGGGGGGGSDYVDPSATNVTITDGANGVGVNAEGIDGSLVITYTAPAPVLTPTDGATQHATEGAPMNNATLGTFTDSNNAAVASDFTATTCWNDTGTPPPNNDCTATTVSGSNGSFTVTGSHTFPEEGSYTAVTSISGADGTTSVNTPVTVADANLTATGIKVTFKTGKAFTKQVANFRDADPAGTTSDYSATINWGDGTSTSGGLISPNGMGGWSVTGSHKYTRPSNGYTVTITIHDSGGATTSTTSVIKAN